MNPLQRAARPSAARRILNVHLVPLANTTTTTPARWSRNSSSSSNQGAPYDPVPQGELGVGELEGAKFKIEPLRRTGEDPETMRARLTYQSRKRGTLESDLLLSTFAAAHLPAMTPAQMREYDLFLDENDWDIYYWATQPTSLPSSSPSTTNTPAAGLQSSEPYLGAQGAAAEQEGQGRDAAAAAAAPATGPVAPTKGEWAQTVGTFKPAFRPVPARWRDSEILGLLRAHVKARSAAGVLGNGRERETAEGMAFMPPLGARK